MIILSKLKSYALYALAGGAAVLYFLLRIKTHQVDNLKLEAQKTKRLALERQRKQATKAIEALAEAEKEGKQRVEQALERSRSGRRDHFE